MVIERVARALCAEGGFDPAEIMANDGPRWRYYVPVARAAIEALSANVSDEMATAAKNVWLDNLRAGTSVTPNLWKKAISASLRAALSEGKGV